MCFYARTIFDCQHEIWGRRIKPCAAAESFNDGTRLNTCTVKTPHGLHTIKLTRKCDNCTQLIGKLSVAREKLAGCRKRFETKWKTGDKSETIELWLEKTNAVGNSLNCSLSADEPKQELIKSHDGWIRAAEVDTDPSTRITASDETNHNLGEGEATIQNGFDLSSEPSSSPSSGEICYTHGSHTSATSEMPRAEVTAAKVPLEETPVEEPNGITETRPTVLKKVPRSRLAVPVSKLPRRPPPPEVVSQIPKPRFQSRLPQPLSKPWGFK